MSTWQQAKDEHTRSVAEGLRTAARLARMKTMMAMSGIVDSAEMTFDNFAEELEKVAEHLEHVATNTLNMH